MKFLIKVQREGDKPTYYKAPHMGTTSNRGRAHVYDDVSYKEVQGGINGKHTRLVYVGP